MIATNQILPGTKRFIKDCLTLLTTRLVTYLLDHLLEYCNVALKNIRLATKSFRFFFMIFKATLLIQITNIDQLCIDYFVR